MLNLKKISKKVDKLISQISLKDFNDYLIESEIKIDFKKMTKKELHQQINKNFYKYVEKNYPQFYIDHAGSNGGRINLVSPSNSWDDLIEYHQSQHTVICCNWASEETKNIMKDLEKFLEIQLKTHPVL